MKKNLLLGCITAIALLTSAASADPSCQERAADGTCLDSAAPTTGQFSNANDQIGAHTATGLRSTQAHANVKLTEATYVLAHQICRYVDNPAAHGALFIGLENKQEWTSFIASPPAGVDLKYCCQTATVQICGKATTIPFGTAGKSYSFAGGYNFKATYTCGTNISGIAPTVDTSWAVATSGACAAPPPADDTCKQNLHVSADCQTDDDGSTGDQHEGGGAGDNGSGKGPGGNNPGNGGGQA